MVTSRGVAKKSGPEAGNERDLDATVRWLRGLSTDEIGQLREAIEKHDTESLAIFAIRFATCLDLAGRSCSGLASLRHFERGRHVELNAGQQAMAFADKRQAMTFALAWAQFHQPSEVRVYGSFGKFDRSITLPEGNYAPCPGADRRRTRAAIGFRDRRQQERRAQV